MKEAAIGLCNAVDVLSLNDIEVCVANGEGPPSDYSVGGCGWPSQDEEFEDQHHAGANVGTRGENSVHTLIKLKGEREVVHVHVGYSMQYSGTSLKGHSG